MDAAQRAAKRPEIIARHERKADYMIDRRPPRWRELLRYHLRVIRRERRKMEFGQNLSCILDPHQGWRYSSPYANLRSRMRRSIDADLRRAISEQFRRFPNVMIGVGLELARIGSAPPRGQGGSRHDAIP